MGVDLSGDKSRINPIAYKSFIPKMDVIFEAEPDTVGTTDFDIDSSVNIRPIMALINITMWLADIRHIMV
ncbi:leukocidin family pore-forming toxin [Photobacterium leiognathi]|uniref:leukocidin family pore-forming toxin n=1 Tax=Photobacterium leiognathi TaxID=553611 RepID=UPI0034E53552